MSKLMRELRQAEALRQSRQLAPDHAAFEVEAEQAARGRIAGNATRLVEMKAQELAEAEAKALAEIRARSERTLAAQAEALRDAENKLELAAIDRRSADLEAAREAKQREANEAAAREATEKRIAAEQAAEQAAREKADAAASATTAAEERRTAALAEKSALAARRRAQWAAFWAGARFKPVATIGTAMLVAGFSGGIWLSGNALGLPFSSGEMPELKLQLDDNVAAVAARAALLPPPRDLPQTRRRR